MDMEKKTAIVTGGSRGIWAAAVRLLAENGWRVAVGCYQRLERANALCASLAAEGCPISRRTVAKYRDELNLPGASGRRAR